MLLLCCEGGHVTLLARCTSEFALAAVALVGAAMVCAYVYVHWCGVKEGAKG